MDTVIFLISCAKTQDSAGVWRNSETKRQIWATVESVDRAEFYKAGEAGLRPALKLTTAAVNYRGEEEAEIAGKRYQIYRSYAGKGDMREIYLQERVGVNGGIR